MRRSPFRIRAARAVGLAVGLGLVLVAAGPSAGEEPGAGLARFVPAKNLMTYVEFDGLDNHREAWRKSAAFKLLNDTTLGALLEDLIAQGFDAAGRGPVQQRVSGADLTGALEQAFRQGFVFAVAGKSADESRVVFVARGGARPGDRTLLGLLRNLIVVGAGADVKTQGRTVTLVGQGDRSLAFWDEKGDLVITTRAHVDRVLAAVEGKEPSAAGSPILAELRKAEAGFEPVGVAFVDVTVLSAPTPDADRLGLDGLKRVDFRWGFQGDALLSVLRLVAPAPRKGLLALLDQPGFGLASLPPLPEGLAGFTVLALDPATTYDRVVAMIKANNPGGAEGVERAEEGLRGALGVDLRRDLLAHLGAKWAVYIRPDRDGQANPWAAFGDLTVTVPVDDAGAVAKALEPLMRAVNRQLGMRPPQGGVVPEFRRFEEPRLTYVLALPPGVLPGPLAGLEPVVTLGKKQLVIAGGREAAEAAVALSEREGGRWSPAGPFVAATRGLPNGMVLLNVNDPRGTLPLVVAGLPALLQGVNGAIAAGAARGNPNAPPRPALAIRVDPALIPDREDMAKLLFPGSVAVSVDGQGVRAVSRDAFPSVTSPGSVGVAVALLLPAVQASREAARRSQCVNNLKQIGLALHNYHSTYNELPKAAITDKKGKPLLSWRVALLPFLEQQGLYDQFHLDEPWNSPHNRALLRSMPQVYACPSATRRDPSVTGYRAFVGKGTLLEADRATKFGDVVDGTSNTIAVVEAGEAVPWTKPDDLPFDPAKPPEGLGGAGSPHPGGFNALFADGAVRFISNRVDVRVFHAMITRAGGEVVQVGNE